MEIAILILAALWLARILFESVWSAVKGVEHPRIARQRAREELAARRGRPTIGQAAAERVAHRIENPPERRWLVQLREVLDELWADALDETRVNHQQAKFEREQERERARRRADQRGGWRVRTGGPTRPRPEPAPQQSATDDGDIDTFPCTGCADGYVLDDGDLCDACADLAPPPVPEPDLGPDTEPFPVVTDDDLPHDPDPDRKAPSMTEHHHITGDVSDPRAALFFALSSRALNEAIGRELDALAANLRAEKLGDGLVGEVTRLADATRTYARSSQDSAVEYAQQVIIQAEIAGDDDLKDTVQGTYLDTRGGDVRSVPRQGGKSTINAADCRRPDAAARIMTAVADVYRQMQVRTDDALGQHGKDEVAGPSVAFFRKQRELATWIAGQAEGAGQRFRSHASKRNDTVVKNRSIVGTQRGHYLDANAR